MNYWNQKEEACNFHVYYKEKSSNIQGQGLKIVSVGHSKSEFQGLCFEGQGRKYFHLSLHTTDITKWQNFPSMVAQNKIT